MKYKYRTVDISTLKGLKLAERLKANGWNVISVGFFTVMLEKQVRRTHETET